MFDPWILIEQENINVFYTNKLPDKINAVYDRDETGAIIILRKGLIHIEERCVLAHELGHHFLSAGNSITTCYSLVERINLSRTEKRANDWAIKHLLPKDEFIKTLEIGLEVWDMAEKFDVTEEAVEYTKKIYR